MKYDLEERTAKFAENTIRLLKKVSISPINKRIIEQLVGSSGSIGANYNEANEFLAVAEPDQKDGLRILWQEAHELLLIFSKILSSRKLSN